MEKSIGKLLLSVFQTAAVILTASCTKEEASCETAGGVVINATAILPGGDTKMIYEDHCAEGKGVKSGWVTGDTFLAFEINGTTVTPVSFCATAPADVKTTFSSSSAVPADENTRWIAVLGKGARFENGKISCSYTSQDGSVKGLEGVDYMTATASGATPEFNYAEGKHLSHLLRIKAPEGVGAVEFNTCAEGAEWTVGSDGSIVSGKADFRPKAVKSFSMKKETKTGDILYLAVPAIDYSDAGLIVTVASSDGKKSQGKVASADFSALGGKYGSYDMSADALIDRPATSEAIDFITGSSVSIEHLNNTSWEGLSDRYAFSADAKWAPFNLGAKANPTSAEECYGELYSWGELTQKDSYSWNNYKRSGEHGSIGSARALKGDKDITLDVATISGTKYDAARVKWGKDWRMPYLEDILSLLGNNEVVNTSKGQRVTTTNAMVTTDESSWYGIDVLGRSFTRNGRKLFLPYAGRYFYSSGKETSSKSYEAKAGCYWCGAHNITAGSKEAYRLFVRDNQIDCDSQETGYGFSIRPVRALESDEPVPPVKVTGKVTDSSTGRGISGVAVSDGYTVCKTSSDGTYSIEADSRSRNICVTVPASYEIPLGGDGRPAFYQLVKVSSYNGESIDFSLTPRKTSSSRFTIVTVADAHVKTDANLRRFRNEAVPDIKATISELESEGDAGTVIGIALGDQMWDNMAMAEPLKSIYAGFTTSAGTMPFFHVIGNHDHQSGVGTTDEVATQVFLENFGPRDYSFDIGNAHVIVMDGIDYKGEDEGEKIKYRERITGEQLHWLKDDVAAVDGKNSKLCIFCIHAPVYNGLGNLDGIKSLLRQFSEAHILSGHIHNMRNEFFKGETCKGGRTLIEHNIQSLSGMWWDADLTCNGTPHGYGVYTFDGARLVREYNKITGESKDFQMRVYSGNDVYNGRTANSGYSSYKKNTDYKWTDTDSAYRGKFLVRIWDGDDADITESEAAWKVTFEKDGTSTPMTSIGGMVDKCSAAYIVDILGKPYGTSDSGGGANSLGWWCIDAPGGDPASVTGWKIVAKHTLPGGWSKTYTCSKLSRDYRGYYSGSGYLY